MNKLPANMIREKWLAFFAQKNHFVLPPSSLIPVDDLSLLWINSGVATLKPYFDGRKIPPAMRLTNSQRSIRTNDIENVGYTARHHTLFEMLGNFSIGDYFKKNAIIYAWEFLTSPDWLGLDTGKLYITVYQEDYETYEIWTQVIGIDPNHIIKGTKETNFWDIGEGPCGPNSEIFYDRGIKYDPSNQGLKLLKEDIENDRYLEIWNIVFSEFNHMPDNTYKPLPRKNIDTGAGLERIASVLQETPTNFETDLFLPIIEATEKLTSKNFFYDPEAIFKVEKNQLTTNVAFKVIADHIRAITFAIADGVFPSNKERGYIIRRLIRRAALFGKKLGINQQFLYQLVPIVVSIMQPYYHYLLTKQEIIVKVVYDEETKFLLTLEQGIKFFYEIKDKYHYISKENALRLFESYGFPIELILEEAANNKIAVDKDGFYQLLNEVKEFSRQQRGTIKAMKLQHEIYTDLVIPSIFVGYEIETVPNAQVIMLIKDNQKVESLTNETGIIILDKTPFYAEKGGQAADRGIISNENVTCNVIDVQQGPNKQHFHQVNVRGKLNINDKVQATIDQERRYYTRKNHSATHLIHAAAREVLGQHVMQIGSYNDNERLRIDISHNTNITSEQLAKIDKWVTDVIKKAIPCEIIYSDLETALKKYHALAFFTEKYDSEVRIVRFAEYSCELCGGTHVTNSQEIEEILITSVESKGSGVYRINAISSFHTIANYLETFFEQEKKMLLNFFEKYNQNNKDISSNTLIKLWNKINLLPIKKQNCDQLKQLSIEFQEEFKKWQKQYQNFSLQKFVKEHHNIEPLTTFVNGTKFIVHNFNHNVDLNHLKALADDYRQQSEQVIVILTSQNNDKYNFVIGVNKSLEMIFSAQKIQTLLNKIILTKGGGNLGMVQGSFQTDKKITSIIEKLVSLLNHER